MNGAGKFVAALAIFFLLAQSAPTTAEEPTFKAKSVATYGPGGSVREARYYPGETVFLTTSIDGLALDDQVSNVHVQMELVDEDTHLIQSFPAADFKPQLLGGNCLKYVSTAKLPERLRIGKCRLRITVRDDVQHVKSTESLDLEIIDSDTFGAADLLFARGNDFGQNCGSIYSVGQNGFLLCHLRGLRALNNAFKVKATIDIVDAHKESAGRTFSLEQEFVDESQDSLVLGNYPLPKLFVNFFVSREGRFEARYTIEDLNSSARVEYTLPFVAIDMSAPADASTAAQRTADRDAARAPKR